MQSVSVVIKWPGRCVRLGYTARLETVSPIYVLASQLQSRNGDIQLRNHVSNGKNGLNVNSYDRNLIKANNLGYSQHGFPRKSGISYASWWLKRKSSFDACVCTHVDYPLSFLDSRKVNLYVEQKVVQKTEWMVSRCEIFAPYPHAFKRIRRW